MVKNHILKRSFIMDTLFDIIVNISPILLVFGLYCTCKVEKGRYIWKILNWTTWILLGISLSRCALGYGFFPIAIIFLILVIVLNVFCLYRAFSKEFLFEILLFGAFIILYLYYIYERLNYEGILYIEFIDKIKVFGTLLSIIQNEWVKGIIIAASGGIISGLVLNKISKKK